MTSHHPPIEKERRKGQDPLVRMLLWLIVVGWLLVIITVVLVGYARPEFGTFFDRYYRIRMRHYWNSEFLDAAFYIMIATFGLSVIGAGISFLRIHRKKDEFYYSFVVLGTISLAGIILYLVSF